jgi:hypothetical protein
VHWAWIGFDVAVIEERWCRDVDVDDTEYGTGVAIKGQVEAVVVGQKEHRVCAGITFGAVGLLVCESFHV